LVVSGAPAEVAGQPVADLGLGRVELPLEQGVAGHEESRRADAALEGGVLEEALLQGMERLALGQALDRFDPSPPDLAAQHEARAHEPAVQRDAAGAAVAGRAAFLAAGQVQGVAEHVQQRFFRFAEELHLVAVDRRFDVVLGHRSALAGSGGFMAARRVTPPATSMRNSPVPRLSSIGRHAARAAASSLSCAARSSRLPMMACAASGTSSTRAATAPSDTRAAVTMPAPSPVKLTPPPTAATPI